MKQLVRVIVISTILMATACSGPSNELGLPSPASTPSPPERTATSVAALISAERTAVDTASSPTPALDQMTSPVPSTPAAMPQPSPTAQPIATPPIVAAIPQSWQVPILMYHYVRPDPGPNDPMGRDLSVTPADFTAEMQYIADHGYTTMTLSELGDVRAGKLSLPAKPVVLTFDDGYDDFYSLAWPVLEQHHFKATIFVVSGFIDQPRYLTWDQVRELDKSGYVEIGAHTVHHVDLATQTTSVAWAEIEGSKTTIEQQVGHPVTSFCYPSGRYSNNVVSQIKQAGFTLATTTSGGFAKAGDDPLLLPRVRIHGTVGMPYVKANLP